MIQPGFLQDAENVQVYNARLASAPGYARVSRGAPNDHTVLLDGNSQYLFAEVAQLGTLVALPLATDWTIDIFCRLDKISGGIALFFGTAFEKDLSQPAFSYAIEVDGQKATIYLADGAVSASKYEITGLDVGVMYHIAFRRNGSDIEGTFAVSDGVSSLPPFSVLGTLGHTVADSPVYRFMVGATNNAGILTGTPSELALNHFPGFVQEVRIWDGAQTPAKLDETLGRQMTDAEALAEADLQTLYRLTGNGDNFYFYTPQKGNTGPNAGEAPILNIAPRSMTWRNSGSILGSPFYNATSMDFDGLGGQFLDVRDSYRYRNSQPDQDGLLFFPDLLTFSFKCNLRSLGRRTIWHYTQVDGEDWVSTNLAETLLTTGDGEFNPVGSTGNMILEIDDKTGAGDYEFRFVVYHDDGSGGTLHATSLSSNTTGITVDTDYTVTVEMDNRGSTIDLSMRVNSMSATTVSSTSTDEVIPTTDDDPSGTNRTYWMTIGIGIDQVRQNLSVIGDPNAVDIEYDFVKAYNGQLRNIILSQPDTSNFTEIHQSNRDLDLTGANLTSLASNVSSFWRGAESSGEVVKDVGFLGNDIIFQEDPEHVWGRSAILTIDREQILGLENHTYLSEENVETQVFVAITPSSVYTVNLQQRNLEFLDDGLRNTESNPWSAAKIPDGLILCCGGKGGNFHLHKTQVFRLAIDPPTGVIPFGLDDQRNKQVANIREGRYQYALTFYSNQTGKESAVGSIFAVDIRVEQANVVIGRDAEINQTTPSTVWSENKEGFDLSTGGAGNNAWIQAASWFGRSPDLLAGDPNWWQDDPDSGSATSPAKYRSVKFFSTDIANTTPLISDPLEVTAKEAADVVNQIDGKVFGEFRSDGRWRLRSDFVGGGAYMRFRNKQTDGIDMISNASVSVFDFGVVGSSNSELVNGSGVKNHGLLLPVSPDPQVTTLRIYRTNTNGSDFHLVAEIPNGTKTYTDSLSDNLNTGPLLDVTRSPAPTVRYVEQYAGQIFYLGDPEFTSRGYFTPVGEPFNVPAQFVIDFRDGDTLELTGAKSTEGALLIFQADTTYSLTASFDPVIPFNIRTRNQDIGNIAPYGIVKFNEMLAWPGVRGFYMYDGSFPRYISGIIDATWESEGRSAKEAIHSVHERARDRVIFFTPTGGFMWDYTNGFDGEYFSGWTTLSNMDVLIASTIPDETGEESIFLADSQGYVYRWNEGTNYGVGELTPRTLTVDSGTATTLDIPMVNSYTTLPDGYRGFIGALVSSDGTRQIRTVTADTLAAVDPTTITVDEAFSPLPVAGDTFEVGPIESVARLGDLDFGHQMSEKEWSDFQLSQTQTTPAAEIEFLYLAWGSINTTGIERSKTFSNSKYVMNLIGITGHGQRLRAGFRSLGPDKPFEINSVQFLMRLVSERGKYLKNK